MGRKPDFYIYEDVPDPTPEQPKPDWQIAGSGWFHKDGGGGNIIMDDGKRYIMRAPRRKDADADPQA